MSLMCHIRYDMLAVVDHYLSNELLEAISSQQAANQVVLTLYVLIPASCNHHLFHIKWQVPSSQKLSFS